MDRVRDDWRNIESIFPILHWTSNFNAVYDAITLSSDAVSGDVKHDRVDIKFKDENGIVHQFRVYEVSCSVS